MKRLVGISILALLAFSAQAQVVKDLRPNAGLKMEEFTGWMKADVVWDDGSKAVIEYRIGLMDRKGIACHYDLEVKNTHTEKLIIVGMSSYYDQLVKSNFGDEIKETLKPGKSAVMRFIAQGCKKEKGTDKDDVGICNACDFGISIVVLKP